MLTYSDNHSVTLIAIGLYVPGTGFTRVLQSIFSHLKDYEVHWIGIGYKGNIIENENYTLYPCNVEGGDMYGAYQAVEMCQAVDADTILLLNDFWMIKNYQFPFSSLIPEVKTMAYIPLDGDIDDATHIEGALWLDEIVLYNQHAYREVTQALDNLNHNGLEDRPYIRVIPHGVDYETFREFSSSQAKSEIFHDLPDSKESLFILNANRYVKRKDLEKTLEIYAQSLPLFSLNTYLVLHLPNTPIADKEEILQYIAQLKISEKVIINPLGEEYVEDKELNLLYNACEIGINTSMGEGWGMVTFEHALTGAAQIVPDHTACGTLWKSHGEVISAPQPIKLMTNPFVMYKSDTTSGCEALIQLVNNPRHLEKSKKRCVERAQSIEFSWARIGTEWMEVLTPVTVQ